VDGGKVTGVETTEGPVAADIVVLAAGAWSIELAAGIGVDLHCSPDGYQAMTTQPMALHLAQVLSSMRRMISLKQLPDGRYLLGGGWPGHFALTDPRGQVIDENIANNLEAAVGILPDVARTIVQESWIGIDAHGHDEVPVLGHVDGLEGLIVATGFSGHGFALSPAVGEAIAGLITTGTSPIDISQLSLSRFDGVPSEASEVRHAG
jgi:sarcosine oxidase subunit beta